MGTAVSGFAFLTQKGTKHAQESRSWAWTQHLKYRGVYTAPSGPGGAHRAVEHHEALVEVVMLQGRVAVQLGQRVLAPAGRREKTLRTVGSA